MRTNSLLPIASLALQFAQVNRATFHHDGERPESDADHTVMLGLLAVHLAGEHPELGLHVGRLAALALVHDLPEVYAGDTNTTGGLSPEQRREKEHREAVARERLRDELGADSPIVALIERYEAQDSAEARFLRYLDKITPKLTHALNGNAAIRRAGHSVEWLRARHRAQGDELAERYPEFAGVLGPLFDAACAESEEALARGAA
jgi:putative hydrolase of HD superfamily